MCINIILGNIQTACVFFVSGQKLSQAFLKFYGIKKPLPSGRGDTDTFLPVPPLKMHTPTLGRWRRMQKRRANWRGRGVCSISSNATSTRPPRDLHVTSTWSDCRHVPTQTFSFVPLLGRLACVSRIVRPTEVENLSTDSELGTCPDDNWI